MKGLAQTVRLKKKKSNVVVEHQFENDGAPPA